MKSLLWTARPREKEKQFRCLQGAVAEQTTQGTRLVDVLCGEECDTPQGSEPVANQTRTDDYGMNGTSDSASGARKRSKRAWRFRC